MRESDRNGDRMSKHDKNGHICIMVTMVTNLLGASTAPVLYNEQTPLNAHFLN